MKIDSNIWLTSKYKLGKSATIPIEKNEALKAVHSLLGWTQAEPNGDLC